MPSAVGPPQLHGKQAKLIHWMWFGWARPKDGSFNAEHQRFMIHSLKENLPEPWGLVNG